MPPVRFQIYTFLGSCPWCFGLAWVGVKLGERWNSDARLRDWMHRFDAVVAIALAARIAMFVWKRWKGTR
jgi:membrane protein DedA with SNARE-associated domain